MCACYLYAIIQASDEDATLLATVGPGLCEQPLQRVREGELAAVISEWPSTAKQTLRQPIEADLWRHEQVIEGLMEQTPTLPARFGATLPDGAQVQQLLVKRRSDFTADLAYVADRVEMGLRVLWEPPATSLTEAPERPDSGRAYLAQRLLKQQQAQALRAQGEALAEQVNAKLLAWAVAGQRQILLTERLLLSSAYLVERPLVATFQAQIEALCQAHPALAFLATGPWPAYHFVGQAQPVENL